MASRTTEEILAQREAWLARKAARDAGEDIPIIPPLKPGEEPPQVIAPTESRPEATAEPEPAPPPEPVAARAAAEPESSPPPAAPQKIEPQKPGQKRTPEEIQAQREAWLARKAAQGASQETPASIAKAAAPAAVAEAPAPVAAKPAPKPAAAAKPAAAPPKPAAKPAPTPGPEMSEALATRRELLNYAWLASIALFSLEAVGFSLWFAFPNFREGQFGGLFPIGPASDVLPEVNSAPVPFTDGKFWLVNLDTEFDGEPRQGVLAIYKVCTHLGCLYEWVPMTGRFECPCHGSKFSLTGDYLAGPARRNLDRFIIQAVGSDGAIRAETDPDGGPLIIEEGDQLVIDTGRRVLGSSDIVPA